MATADDEEPEAVSDTNDGYGRLWLTLERFGVEATVPATPNNWQALWRNGKHPKLKGDTIDDSWERTSVVFRAIDPLLNRPKRREGESRTYDVDLPEEEPQSEKVFASSPARAADTYGPWPPRVPDLATRLTIVELRIGMSKLIADLLAAIAISADCRFGVLTAWTDPGLKRDTPEGILDRMCGETSRFLNGAKGDNAGYAPPDTPVRNSEERLRTDRFVVLMLDEPGQKGLFPPFQDSLRTLGLQVIVDGREATWRGSKVERSQPVPRRMAERQAETFVAGELFLEASNKYLLERERRAEAVQITTKMIRQAAQYQKSLRLVKDSVYPGGLPDSLPTLLTQLQKLSRASAVLCTRASAYARDLFGKIFGGLDLALLEWLNVDCVRHLAETDVVEPAVRRRRMPEVNARQLELSMLRHTMEAEQQSAFTMLSRLREMIEAPLESWNERFQAQVVEYVYVTGSIGDLRGDLVDDKSKPLQSSTTPWKEKFTKTKFASLSEHLFRYVIPSLVRDRVTAYRALAKTHLSRIQGLVRDERKPSASPLKPPDESLFKRGLALYEAMIAVRDLLLPSVETAAMRASLVGCVDLLFAGHLKAAKGYAAVRESWVTAWKGALGPRQVASLIRPDARPDTNWFNTVPQRYELLPDRLGTVGFASNALSIYDSMRNTAALRIRRRWVGPAVDWLYWVEELPRRVAPMEVSSTPLPLSVAEDADRDWMNVDDPLADQFMTDEDLFDIGRTRTTLPTIVMEGTPPGAPEDGRISLVSIAEDEATVVPEGAYDAVNKWLTEHTTVGSRNYRPTFDTPLWQVLRTAVARTYIARFHPLVKERGPVFQAQKRMDKLEELLVEIEDILEDRAMDVDGSKPRKAKLSKEDKIVLAAWKDNVSNTTGLRSS